MSVVKLRQCWQEANSLLTSASFAAAIPALGRPERQLLQTTKAYIAIICSPAQAIDHSVTPYTHPVAVADEDDDSVFNYLDTAATKAGIVAANRKLEGPKIAIVGAGGTGGYVLDFTAKTPVAEIHLFDHDVFLNHNAFRCPGAPSLDDLSKKQAKVDYLASVYSCAGEHARVLARVRPSLGT